MVEQVDTIVIGGGQAGLSVSWHLRKCQREHLLLDRGNVGDTWRHRWDSFCLVTPNHFCRLPGFYFVGLHWMHTAGSGLFSQVGRDAEYVVEHLNRHRTSS